MEGGTTDYERALEEAKWRFSTHGIRASERAYNYGVLVVKNAFLVAGGGLFFIPTMVGLSAEVSLPEAFVAGLLFAVSVLLALVGNYVIHINWMLHETAWDKVYEIERINIRAAFNRQFPKDVEDRQKAEGSLAKTNKWISRTFWLPHCLGVFFLSSLIGGCYFLYLSFGVVWAGI